jgi:hypothetical protein
MQIASLQVFRQRDRVVNVRYRVELSESERLELQGMLSGGEEAVRRLKRAQILLASDLGQGEEVIAKTLGVGVSTVYRTRRRFVEGNLEGALGRGAAAGERAQGSAAGGYGVFERPFRVCALDAEIAGWAHG